ncbi:MAG: hypothetical protein ACRD2F_01785 [Terriglobales bacterium]
MPTKQSAKAPKAKPKNPPTSSRVKTARRVRKEEEQETAERARREERLLPTNRRSRKRDGELFTI